MEKELFEEIMKDINTEINKSEMSLERETRRENKKYHIGTIEALKKAKIIIMVNILLNEE